MRVVQRLRKFTILIALLGFIYSISPSAAGNKLSDDYDQLFLFVTIISAIVAILVVGLWVYFMKTFSENNDVERVPLSHETTRKLELGWTLLAIVIVILLMIVSYPVLFELDADADLEADRIVYVKAVEFSWVFSYQNSTLDYVSGDPILDAGFNYKFIITSKGNFIHSFFVPDLRFKMDAIPGVNNTIVISISEPGIYGITCAEYCGAGHSLMRFSTITVR